MKSLAILLTLALTGCAFDGALLDNRLACTVAKDKLYVVSNYGPVGIASTIADADAKVVCK